MQNIADCKNRFQRPTHLVCVCVRHTDNYIQTGKLSLVINCINISSYAFICVVVLMPDKNSNNNDDDKRKKRKECQTIYKSGIQLLLKPNPMTFWHENVFAWIYFND